MVEPAAREARPRASSSGSTDAPARVLGDETRIKQILTNLLSNAVKYNVDGGRIVIARARSPKPQMVEIAVSDTGLGMTRAQMDELFQPYNRLGRERTAQSRAPASAWSSAGAWPN